MSVRVNIDIEIAGGAAHRHLEINRVRTGENGSPNTHEVILSGRGARDRAPVAALFQHSFEDDVLTLITESIAALRQSGVARA